MTLDQAIENLEEEAQFEREEENPIMAAAIQLGIEALKRIQEDEYRGTEVPRPLLPGETEE